MGCQCISFLTWGVHLSRTAVISLIQWLCMCWASSRSGEPLFNLLTHLALENDLPRQNWRACFYHLSSLSPLCTPSSPLFLSADHLYTVLLISVELSAYITLLDSTVLWISTHSAFPHTVHHPLHLLLSLPAVFLTITHQPPEKAEIKALWME